MPSFTSGVVLVLRIWCCLHHWSDGQVFVHSLMSWMCTTSGRLASPHYSHWLISLQWKNLASAAVTCWSTGRQTEPALLPMLLSLRKMDVSPWETRMWVCNISVAAAGNGDVRRCQVGVYCCCKRWTAAAAAASAAGFGRWPVCFTCAASRACDELRADWTKPARRGRLPTALCVAADSASAPADLTAMRDEAGDN